MGVLRFYMSWIMIACQAGSKLNNTWKICQFKGINEDFSIENKLILYACCLKKKILWILILILIIEMEIIILIKIEKNM